MVSRVLVVIGGLLLASPALAQGTGQGGGGSSQFANFCRAPLKFAAGACVAVCPAGYLDLGRVCAFYRPNGGPN